MAIVNFNNNNLIQYLMTTIRKQDTSSYIFREYLESVFHLMAGHALADIKVVDRKVQTPLGEYNGKSLEGEIFLVPVMRAGLGPLHIFNHLLPKATTIFIGAKRRADHSGQSDVYYINAPEQFKSDSSCLVLEPMIATGNSMRHVLDILTARKASNIKVLSIVAYDKNLEALSQEYPQVAFYVAQVDDKIDHHKYIVPGLGDAGDRIYNTLEDE